MSLAGTYHIKDEQDFSDIAKKAVAELSRGGVLELIGDLGAGKTTFTKYLGKELGVQDDITSPTFTVIAEYEAHVPSINKLYHADLYRLSKEEAAEDILVRELIGLSGVPGTVTVIEWADRLPKHIEGAYTLTFSIDKEDGESRMVAINKT